MKTVLLAAGFAAITLPAYAANLGHASYYGREFAGKRTASGEKFVPSGLTAAHRSLPFGTKLKLTNILNGRSVVVRVNDRGPFVRGRVIDVSQGAAQALGFVGRGTATLRIEPFAATATPISTPAPLDAIEKPAEIEAVAHEEPILSHVDRAIQNK